MAHNPMAATDRPQPGRVRLATNRAAQNNDTTVSTFRPGSTMLTSVANAPTNPPRVDVTSSYRSCQ